MGDIVKTVEDVKKGDKILQKANLELLCIFIQLFLFSQKMPSPQTIFTTKSKTHIRDKGSVHAPTQKKIYTERVHGEEDKLAWGREMQME